MNMRSRSVYGSILISVPTCAYLGNPDGPALSRHGGGRVVLAWLACPRTPDGYLAASTTSGPGQMAQSAVSPKNALLLERVALQAL